MNMTAKCKCYSILESGPGKGFSSFIVVKKDKIKNNTKRKILFTFVITLHTQIKYFIINYLKI